MERKIALTLLFCSLLGSAVAETNNKQLFDSSYGRKKINEAVGEKVISQPSLPKIDYVPQKQKVELKKESALSFFLGRNPKVSQANLFILLKEEKGKSRSSPVSSAGSVSSVSATSSSLNLTGECYFPRDLSVSSLPLPVVLRCVFGSKTGKLYGELTAKGYSLILLPKKVMMEERIYNVKSGFAINEATQDLNVASSVNKRILDKILIAGAGAGLEGVKEGVKEYYENKDTTTYTQDQTVVQEKKIDKEYPLIYGAISFVSGAFSELVNLFKKEYGTVPVIWKVKAGTTVKVVLEVEAGK